MKKLIFILILIFCISYVSADKVYLVDMGFEKDNVFIKEVYVKDGYSPDYRLSGAYVLSLWDTDKNKLSGFNFEVPNKIFSDTYYNYSTYGDVEVLEKGDFALIVPYDDRSNLMSVDKDGKSLSEYDLSKYTETKKNKNAIYWVLFIIVILLILAILFYIFRKVKTLNNSSV